MGHANRPGNGAGQGRRPLVVLTLAAVVALTVACGQKPGVIDLSAPPQPVVLALPPGAHVDPTTGKIIDAQGNVIGAVPEGSAGSLSTQPGTALAGAGTGSTSDSATGSDAAGGSAPVSATATGVSATTIEIGGHAPLTGAAPIPSDSAQKGNDLYYKWLDHNDQAINGRRVHAILKNDNYNPSQAVAVCKEMVEKDRVFLLYGFAGTDQIQACARYAGSAGVPYISAGATEVGMHDLPGYFAVWLTYVEQGPLLADYLFEKLGAAEERNGMLRFDTPNFQDAHDSFIRAMKQKGAPVAYDRAVSKSAGQTEAQAVVQEMKAQRLQNVYVLTSPVWFLQVLQAARTQDYSPQWVGVGITKALDTVASVGCRNGTVNGARFFSPFPAWADIDRFDPEFKKAVQAVYPSKEGGDDFMVIGWGFARVVAGMLEIAGKDLTRESFVAESSRARNIKTGVYPPVSFSPNDRFGGTAMHVNEAQCSGYKAGDNRWHTIQPFVSDF